MRLAELAEKEAVSLLVELLDPFGAVVELGVNLVGSVSRERPEREGRVLNKKWTWQQTFLRPERITDVLCPPGMVDMASFAESE
jgi:hypothetical protein